MVDVAFKTVEELCSIGLCLGATPMFTDCEMKFAMNAMDARVLSILPNAFAQCTRPLYTTRNA
jgi:hypothetical protein